MIDFDPDSELPTLSLEPDVLLVGVSTRAAAFSARRAGFMPLCIDQFSDTDLQAAASTLRAPEFPEQVTQLAVQVPPIPVIYGGGCENQPELLEQLARQRPLWGNPPEILRRVRNPFDFYDVLAATRLPALPVRPADQPPTAGDGAWLNKPLRSGGGLGIHRWAPGEAVPAGSYFQKFQEGEAYSAVFVAGKGPGDVRFVGITRQLLGMPEFGASGFQWSGNVGPVNLEVATELLVRRMGNILKWKFELVGLFGIDFIVDAEGTPWPTEVNPRYTASVELLEWACELNLLGDHCRCFDPHVCIQPFRPAQRPKGAVLGKGILYAPTDGVLKGTSAIGPKGWESWPRCGDVPPSGATIPMGTPICTVYAEGETQAECIAALKQEAARRMTDFVAVTP